MKWLVVLVGGEMALVVCLLAGVPVPGPVLVAAEAVVACVVAAEGVVLWRRSRTMGLRAALRTMVPVAVRKLMLHELRSLYSLVLWAGRRRHGVGDGFAAAYTGPQTAMMYGLLFVSVIETVALAWLIPWPVVDAIVLVLDLYGVLFVIALHASCVVRPHVAGRDGSLRIRYGALFDLRLAAQDIASVRVDRRYPGGGLITYDAEAGVLDLSVGGQSTVTVELAGPVAFVRPLGAHGTARTVRFHADDPQALVTQVRTGRSPLPDLPA